LICIVEEMERPLKMVIKTVIFDFGGVLYHTPDRNWMKRWKKVLGLKDDPQIAEILANPNESELMNEICLGNISEDQMWQMIAEKWGIGPGMISRLRKQAFSRKHLNKPLVKFLAQLQEDYQTAILSNAGDQTREIMEDIYHLDRYVEEIVISAEEGVIKPDHKIFRITMDRLKAKPETSLFIDDYPVNVAAARDFGMKAVQFVTTDQTIQEIQTQLSEEH